MSTFGSISNRKAKECYFCWKLLEDKNNVHCCSKIEFENCKKYICPEILENSSRRCSKSNVPIREEVPICFTCHESTQKLTLVKEVLESVEKELQEVVDSFNTYIVNFRSDGNERGRIQGTISTDETANDEYNSDFENDYSPGEQSNDDFQNTEISDELSEQSSTKKKKKGQGTAVDPLAVCQTDLERVEYPQYDDTNPHTSEINATRDVSRGNSKITTRIQSSTKEDNLSQFCDRRQQSIVNASDNEMNYEDVDIKDVIIEEYDAEVDDNSQPQRLKTVAVAKKALPIANRNKSKNKSACKAVPSSTTKHYFDKEIRVILHRISLEDTRESETKSSKITSVKRCRRRAATKTNTRIKVTSEAEKDIRINSEDIDDGSSSDRELPLLKSRYFRRLKDREGFVYPCSACTEKFNYHYELKQHLRKEHPEIVDITHFYSIKCKKCGQKFKNSKALEVHNRWRHKKDANEEKVEVVNWTKPKYPCSTCGKVFTRISNRRQHMIIMHSETKLYHCKSCDASFNYLSQLDHHQAEAHITEFNFPCDICPEKFKLKSYLKLHQRRHQENELLKNNDKGNHFQCDICNQSFKKEDSNYFLQHMFFHKNENSFKCTLCDNISYPTKVLLEKHIQECHYDGFPCQLCGTKFSSSKSLSSHKSSMHTEGPECICDICGAAFKNISYLRTHKKIHGERSLQCDYCEKKFVTQDYRRSHIKSIHFKELNVTYCEFCGKGFNKQHYKQHLLTHTKEKRHKCDQCDQAYTSSPLLLGHKRRLHGLEKLSCKLCDKQFNGANNLVTHMRVHTGEKPYECSCCLKRFDRKCNLITHMRFHTGEKPYKCQKCGNSFSRKDNFNIHSRKCTL